MRLADIFYIVGIISMSLYTLLLVAIVILLLYIWKKCIEIQRKVEDRFDEFTHIIKHTKETASELGAAAASSALDQFAHMLRTKK